MSGYFWFSLGLLTMGVAVGVRDRSWFGVTFCGVCIVVVCLLARIDRRRAGNR